MSVTLSFLLFSIFTFLNYVDALRLFLIFLQGNGLTLHYKDHSQITPNAERNIHIELVEVSSFKFALCT